MEALNVRPKLVSFRATRFHGENPVSTKQAQPLSLELTQTIEVGLAIETERENQFQAIVKIDFVATAKQADSGENAAEFTAGYEAKYEYPAGVVEEQVAPLFEQEVYQYMLVAQSFPLAMTHFRRELQSFGVDARMLPLGI
jgi:hypothetical protein